MRLASREKLHEPKVPSHGVTVVAPLDRWSLTRWGDCDPIALSAMLGPPPREVPDLPLAVASERSRTSQRTLLLAAALATLLLYVVAATAAPGTALGATTTTKAALCSANLRSTAAGSRLKVAAPVKGALKKFCPVVPLAVVPVVMIEFTCVHGPLA